MEPDAHRHDLDLFTALDEEPLRGLDPDLGHVDLEGQTDLLSKARGQVVRRGADRAGKQPHRVRIGGSFARTLLPTAIASATYDGANRQRAFGPSQMTFDPNGNLTTITGGLQTTSLTWDARDRLVGLEQSGIQASFAYAFGRRSAKTVSGAATQFLYDGLDLAQQLEPQRTATYLRSLAIDETLGLTNPDGTFFLTADALGSTVSITDGSGSSVTDYTYDPFGAVTATNALPNPFQFTGRENDGLAGLYYYRARYYHPGLARFVSEDPSDASNSAGSYAYALANPLRYGDPLGLFWEEVGLALRGYGYQTHQAAVNEAAARFGTRPVVYQPTQQNYGETFISPSGAIRVEVGPKAFTFLNAGTLASTIGHELQHANEAAAGVPYDFHLSEYRAFQWELNNADVTGMGKWYNRFYNWATDQGLGEIRANMDYHWRKYVEGLRGRLPSTAERNLSGRK